MPFQFFCQCGAKLNARDDQRGKSFNCPKCSRSIVAEPMAATPPPLTPAPKKLLSLNCPSCGSEQTQKLSVVYAGGTSTSASRGRVSGVAMGEDMIPGIGFTNTRAKQTTELAKQVAPPELAKGGIAPGIAIIVTVLFGFLAFGMSTVVFAAANSTDPRGPSILALAAMAMAAITVTAFLAFTSWKLEMKERAKRAVNATDHAAALEKWNASFFCNRCANVFIPEAN